MKIVEYESVADFVRTYSAHWAAHEWESGALLRLHAEPEGRGVCWAVHDEHGAVRQTCYLRTGDQLVLTCADDEVTQCSVDYFVHENMGLPGVFGEAKTASVFVDKLAAHTGDAYRVVKRLHHHELERLLDYEQALGEMRLAMDQDSTLLVEWMDATLAEQNTQRGFETRTFIQTEIARSNMYLWVNTGKCVAMAYLDMARTAQSSYINHVYTPPEHRRKGYASSLVGAMSRPCLERGRCVRLSTDVENHAAHATYRRIGFHVVGDMVNIRRMP